MGWTCCREGNCCSIEVARLDELEAAAVPEDGLLAWLPVVVASPDLVERPPPLMLPTLEPFYEDKVYWAVAEEADG